MIPKGFEPLTRRLEICCSIQLSYGTIEDPKKRTQVDLNPFWLVGVAGFEPPTFCSQSRRDTGLRYTPKIFFHDFIQSIHSFHILSYRPFRSQIGTRYRATLHPEIFSNVTSSSQLFSLPSNPTIFPISDRKAISYHPSHQKYLTQQSHLFLKWNFICCVSQSCNSRSNYS